MQGVVISFYSNNFMSTKRLFLSLGMFVFVVAVAIGGTGAFFSDTETSTGNVFTAGDIDLLVGNESYVTDVNGDLVASAATSWAVSDLTNELFFDFADIKPGDIGEDTIELVVNTNDAWACMSINMTGTPENGQSEPEAAVDATAGANEGELQDELNFAFWGDDGDNVYEVGETIFWEGTAGDIFDGEAVALADSTGNVWDATTDPMTGTQPYYVAKAWCYGALTADPADGTSDDGPLLQGTGFTCSGGAVTNVSQTDGMTADVSFTTEQSRNNSDFTCVAPVIVTNAEIATDIPGLLTDLTQWVFYNDTNNTIMTPNQFSGLGGVNEIAAFAGSNGAAKMVLDSGTNPRYNIATYQFMDVPLADISSIKYRIYDASVSSQTPYLNFNIDFNNSNTWQNRLVHVPTGVAANTWTEVDAIAGGSAMWLYSGATWPAGAVSAGTIPGGTSGTARSWADILADYPNAETRSTDSFFGVRVGHPGPNGEEGYVDYIEFDGVKYDFVN